MASTVQAIITDALAEIGAIGVNETPTAADLAIGLTRFQNQVDAWQAERLTLSFQSETSISWPSSTSTQTIGPSGGNITAQRPVWINQMNYVVPGTSPAVEVAMAPLTQDQYAAVTIKALASGLPQQYFYQTSLTSVLGTIFLWPQPNQNLTIKLYADVGVTVPTALSDTMYGPPGYAEAFMYQLAIRLLTPFGRKVSDIPMLPKLAAEAWGRMQRPNVDPGLRGVDPALVPTYPGGYNIYTDNSSAPYGH